LGERIKDNPLERTGAHVYHPCTGNYQHTYQYVNRRYAYAYKVTHCTCIRTAAHMYRETCEKTRLYEHTHTRSMSINRFAAVSPEFQNHSFLYAVPVFSLCALRSLAHTQTHTEMRTHARMQAGKEMEAELSIQNVLEEINKGFKTSAQDDKVREYVICV